MRETKGVAGSGMRYRKRAAPGISLTGLIAVLIVLSAIALVVIKVVPAYIEYGAVKKAIAKSKADGGGVREMRAAFDRNADINNITAIAGRDLVVERDGEATEISFGYEKRIPLVSNISLLIEFAGTTDPSGVAAKPAQAVK